MRQAEVGHVPDEAALIQVTRGRATQEELAAVVVTLLSLLSAHDRGPEPDNGPPAAGTGHGWAAGAYQAPESWTAAGPVPLRQGW
ncbi:acyl-CoA carboxylase epsilon subunit [Streptomyces longispororuber]|uniref:acyl-CoA carboxylase epsilon subunit n=1 Tax=Streptomyces longispororuber TaxID=68230 RepID=UPI0036F8C970